MACGLEIRNTGRSAGPAPKPADGYQTVAVPNHIAPFFSASGAETTTGKAHLTATDRVTTHAVAATINKAF